MSEKHTYTGDGTAAHEAVDRAYEGPTDPNERPGELAEIISAAFVELAELQDQNSFPALFYVGTDHRVYRLDAHTSGMTRREAHLAGALVVQAKHDLGQMLRASDDPWLPRDPAREWRRPYEGNWTPATGRNRINDLGPSRETQKFIEREMRGYQPEGRPVLAVINEHDVKYGYLDKQKGEFNYESADSLSYSVMPEYDANHHPLVRVLTRNPVKARVWADRSDNEPAPEWQAGTYWGWIDNQGAFCFFPEGDSREDYIWTHNYQKLS